MRGALYMKYVGKKYKPVSKEKQKLPSLSKRLMPR